MIPQHNDMIVVLVESGLAFANVYPRKELKNEYMERYGARDSPEGFMIGVLDKNWDQFVSNQETLRNEGNRQVVSVVLKTGQYLSHRIEEVVESPVFKQMTIVS